MSQVLITNDQCVLMLYKHKRAAVSYNRAEETSVSVLVLY